MEADNKADGKNVPFFVFFFPPSCIDAAPGVWKLSATSWEPQSHIGRGS